MKNIILRFVLIIVIKMVFVSSEDVFVIQVLMEIHVKYHNLVQKIAIDEEYVDMENVIA